MLASISCYLLIRSDDPYKAIMKGLIGQSKTYFSATKLRSMLEDARVANRPPLERYRFGAMTVVAMDKGGITPDNTFFAVEASKLLKRSELKLSSSYCYVVARLGRLGHKVGDLEVEAAKLYYQEKHDGISCFLLAEVLQHHSVSRIRASSLLYALEAQKKQVDSLKVRWLVADGYFNKADYSGEKEMWKAAIDAYNLTAQLAVNEEKTHLLRLANYCKKRFNGEPTDPRRGGIKSGG